MNQYILKPEYLDFLRKLYPNILPPFSTEDFENDFFTTVFGVNFSHLCLALLIAIVRCFDFILEYIFQKSILSISSWEYQTTAPSSSEEENVSNRSLPPTFEFNNYIHIIELSS